MNTYYKGLLAEWWARMYLRMRGFHIVQNRYITGRNTGRAEIDIIARRGNLMIFVEVKCHKTDESAWDAISHAQSARLRRSGETYLARVRWRGDARFDVMIVHGFKINWIRGAI